jgi:hypothetical protein
LADYGQARAQAPLIDCETLIPNPLDFQHGQTYAAANGQPTEQTERPCVLIDGGLIRALAYQ